MGSTRLPGKVLKPVLGRPLLAYHLDRLKRANSLAQIVVATTERDEDDAIVTLCGELGVPVFRGPEQDVLARYAGCAAAFDAAVVVRVTSDCPLIEPALVDEAVGAYLEAEEPPDWLGLDRACYPRGLDVEVVSRGALDRAAAEATDPAEREHVTLYLYRRPDQFACRTYGDGTARPHYRWCVDEAADLDLITRLIEHLVPERPEFTWQDCLEAMSAHPEWADINRHVRQRDSFGHDGGA